jgi:ubiquinone/menaquinone biosynthesis C-methylase UbiE
MKTLTMTYEDYWGEYWRITTRHAIPGILKWDQDLVDLIERQCQLRPPAEILDLGCAGGDQARLFAAKGYSVTGIDRVPRLIEHARETFAKEGLKGQFLLADMRAIEYRTTFDLCTMLSGTFGLPAENEDSMLLESIYRALKPSGKAFIDHLPIESFCRMSRSRTWHDIDGGYALAEEWFDAATSTYRTRHLNIFRDGTIIEAADEDGYGANEIIRCYGAREIEAMARQVGFIVKAHLCRKHIGNPGHEPDENEPRSMLVLMKPA